MLNKRLLIPGVLLCLSVRLVVAAADNRQPAAAAPDARPARSSLSAAQIVDRHVAARGGLAAWRAVQTLSLAGKMDAGTGSGDARRQLAVERRGRSGTTPAAGPGVAAAAEPQVQLPFVLEMKRPHKSRVEIEFAGTTAVQVYDGTQGWKKRPFLNRDGFEPFSADEIRTEAGTAPLDGPLVDFVAKGTKVELEAVEPVNGHDAYRLRLANQNGTIQHVWIDTGSFLDVKVEGLPRRMDGRPHNVYVYQRDFRAVQGVMIPFMLETAVDGYPGTHKMLIEKAAVNPKLDDSRFKKPS